MKMKRVVKIISGIVIVFAIVAWKGDGVCADQGQGKQNVCLKQCDTDLAFEQAMRDRLQAGVDNWNKGYDTWLAWTDTVYEPDAYYTISGQRLSLEQYRALVQQTLTLYDVKLGALDNVLVEGEWIAIRYTAYTTDKQTGVTTATPTMEFAHFKNNPAPIGPRITEGWAISQN